MLAFVTEDVIARFPAPLPPRKRSGGNTAHAPSEGDCQARSAGDGSANLYEVHAEHESRGHESALP